MATYGFWKIAQDAPEHVALIEPDGRKHTAAELLAESNRVVHGLRALGLKPGDTFAAMLTNEAAMLQVYLAATQAGWYVTPINSHLTAPEVAYILQDCEAKALFCSARTVEAGRRAADAVSLPANARFATVKAEGFRDFADLKKDQPAALPSARRAGASMTYTSGTTGQPKGVRRPLPDLDPETVAERNALFLQLFGITPHDNGVHLVGAPLYHTAVLNFCTNHLHFGHTDRADGQVDAGRDARPHRALPRHDHPYGADPVQAPPLPSGRGPREGRRVLAPARDPQRRPVPGRREAADDRVVGERDLRVLRRVRRGRHDGRAAGVDEEARHRRQGVADLEAQGAEGRRDGVRAARDRHRLHEHGRPHVRVPQGQEEDGQRPGRTVSSRWATQGTWTRTGISSSAIARAT